MRTDRQTDRQTDIQTTGRQTDGKHYGAQSLFTILQTRLKI